MDNGERDDRFASEAMQRALKFAAKAEEVGRAGEKYLQIAMLSEALNASGSAVAAIETWRLSLLEERQKLRGEPLDFNIEPVIPPVSELKH